MAPNASPDDVRSALDVTNLSADDPIAMLAANPDRFFGRTTKVRFLNALPGSNLSAHALPSEVVRSAHCVQIVQGGKAESLV